MGGVKGETKGEAKDVTKGDRAYRCRAGYMHMYLPIMAFFRAFGAKGCGFWGCLGLLRGSKMGR